MTRTRIELAAWGLTLALLVACDGDVESTAAAGAGGAAGGSGGSSADLPCALSEFLAARCQQCHAAEPQFGAPMPLVTRADLLATALDDTSSVAEASIARMEADDARMPPPPNTAASSAEIGLLRDWIDAGHPTRGASEMCDDGSGGAGGAMADCTPDVSLTGQEPFEMPATSQDEQICFGIELQAHSDKRHITAILPRIDNNTIIHHMLLLEAPSPVSPEPAPCAFTQLDWKLLYAWGPGTPPHVLPAAAGFPIEAGADAHYVLQVHYNNLQGLSGETDQSGIDLCTTTDLREHDADIMAFGATGFSGIAPQATSQLDCTTPVPGLASAWFPVTVFQSWPHMHQIGTALYSAVENGGDTDVLVDVDDYDFNYQITYPNDSIQIDVGDTVRTTCTWNNTSSQAVGFGEGTLDEMCFNFVSYYPRVEAPIWSWLAPSQSASCDMTTQKPFGERTVNAPTFNATGLRSLELAGTSFYLRDGLMQLWLAVLVDTLAAEPAAWLQRLREDLLYQATIIFDGHLAAQLDGHLDDGDRLETFTRLCARVRADLESTGFTPGTVARRVGGERWDGDMAPRLVRVTDAVLWMAAQARA